jgi:hypothetical protein
MTGVLIDNNAARPGLDVANPPPGVLGPVAPDQTQYPQAGVIEALMQTPEQAYARQLQQHPAATRLQMLAASMNGGPAQMEAMRQTLAARQMEPLALAQQRAAFAGAMLAYHNAAGDPAAQAAILTDLPGYMKQQIANMNLQKMGVNDVLANAANPGGAAPPVPSVIPFAQGPNGVVNTATGAFQGVSQPVTVAPGAQAVPFTPQPAGGTVAPIGGGAAPFSQSSTPTDEGHTGVRGVRNNNPLNLTTLPTGSWAGQTGKDGPFAQFSTPQAGLMAADRNLVAKAQLHGLTTLNGIIGDPTWGWDPKEAGTYIPRVAKELGIDPATPLPLQDTGFRSRLLRSMANVELGAGPAARFFGDGATPTQASAAAANEVQPAPQGQGFGQPIVKGRLAQPLPMQEAQSMGYGPGVAVRKADGTIDFTPAPKDDSDRLAGLTKGLDAAQQLLISSQRFMVHNAKAGTGLQYFDPLEERGGEHNPLAIAEMKTNPDVSQMEAEHSNQTFLIKNPDIGRILQTEIPFWESQAQSIDNTPNVNAQRMTEAAKAYQYMAAKHAYAQSWIYGKGNLNGFDQAFEKYWNGINPDRFQGGQGAQAAQPQAKGAADPLGIR